MRELLVGLVSLLERVYWAIDSFGEPRREQRRRPDQEVKHE
jgi:hypothetical protein